MVVSKKPMKNLPKPFSRPAIEIGVTIKRSWQTVPAQSLKVGDLMPDWGEIVSINLDHMNPMKDLKFTFFNGESGFFSQTHPIFAFTE